jgi:hypothetical protein
MFVNTKSGHDERRVTYRPQLNRLGTAAPGHMVLLENGPFANLE